MKHGLLLIALFIAATALTSGEYSSSYVVSITAPSPNTTTQNPNTTTQNPSTTAQNPSTTTHIPSTTTHNPNTTTHNPNTTTHNPNTTTHNPNTTTHNPNTTTHNPNTTTHNPNTTTHNPNTTTHNPNTTTHNPNTTTHNPNTTTHSPPTTTAMPVPTPPTNVTTGKYNVTDNKGAPCIMLDMAIGIRVNTSKVNGTFIVQPSKTNVSGECLEKVVTLTLAFDEGAISVQFQKNDTTKKSYLRFVQYELNYAFKTGVLSNYSGENRSLELFSVDLGYSYSCQAVTLYMGGGVSLDLTHNRFQAFEIKNKQFGPPELCKADQPDYRVPIAVGIILIILIIIVVIAYLISRKRRTDGYQSL